MLTEAISTAREAVGDCDILVRGDAAFGNSVVINAAINAGARFSMVINKDAAGRVQASRAHNDRFVCALLRVVYGSRSVWLVRFARRVGGVRR
jgi:hypothetical protein